MHFRVHAVDGHEQLLDGFGDPELNVLHLIAVATGQRTTILRSCVCGTETRLNAFMCEDLVHELDRIDVPEELQPTRVAVRRLAELVIHGHDDASLRFISD